MTPLGFTIKDATLTIKSATKYEFNSNMCYQIESGKKYLVLSWYQCEDYHMFFALGSYALEDMKDLMYWFGSEHMLVDEFSLIDVEEGNIVCIGKTSLKEQAPWRMTEVENCLGVYQLENGVFYKVCDSYQEAYEQNLKIWKINLIGVLESSS
jgi:hypothetical protein